MGEEGGDKDLTPPLSILYIIDLQQKAIDYSATNYQNILLLIHKPPRKLISIHRCTYKHC